MNDARPMASARLADVSAKQACALLLALIAASTAGFSVLAYLKYAAFTGQSIDSAIWTHAFSQARQGRFFPNFVCEGGILGQHINLLAFLWLPVFWAVPTVYSLFLMQSLVISLAAWPAYLLARDQTRNRLTALIAAAGFLLFPPIAAQHLSQIHDDPFGLAPLLFAFVFFERMDFRKFAAFLLLSLLAKETIALATASFSIYALMRRRPLKWVAFPAAVSAAYVLLAWKVLLPLWGKVDSLMYSNTLYFAGYGNTPGEVLRYFLTYPTGTLETMFAADRLRYLFRLLLPLWLVLPFGTLAWTTALPNLAMNLVSSNASLRDTNLWYASFPATLVWAAFAVAIPSWSRRLSRYLRTTDCSRSLCVATLLASLAGANLWYFTGDYHRDPAYQARREAIALIPRDASVLCSDNMLAHFSHHPALQSLTGMRLYGWDPNRIFDFDYIVFDRNFALIVDKVAQTQFFELISQMPEYHLVFARDNVFVYQRVGTPARRLQWGPFIPATPNAPR